MKWRWREKIFFAKACINEANVDEQERKTLKFIKSFDDAKIFYYDLKPEGKEKEEREEKALIFVHGYLGHPIIWKFVEKAFSNYRRIMIFNRGHFESEIGKSNEFSYINDCAIDINKIIEEEKITKAVLIGHSMGGMIVLKYFEKFKDEKVKGIVVVSSPMENPFVSTSLFNLEIIGKSLVILKPLLTSDVFDKFFVKIKETAFSRKIQKLLIKLLIKKLFVKNKINERHERLLNLLMEKNFSVKGKTIYIALKSMEKTNFYKSFSENQVRNLLNGFNFLFMIGLNDIIVNWTCNLKMVDYINKNNGHSYLRVFDSNHFPMFEEEEKFLRILNEFFDRSFNDEHANSNVLSTR
jgi:pimeloyl-ACP methyl ester carboxylesterase